MNRDAFREAMRRFPSGVAVVTSVRDGEPRGMTLTAFCSVSADPPTVLVCVNREARSYLYIATSRVFCANFLSGDQRELAERFSGKIREHQFEGVAYSPGRTGAPLLDGAIAHVECEVVQEHHAGSHSIFIGTVVAAESRSGSPLGYFNGGFHDFGIEI